MYHEEGTDEEVGQKGKITQDGDAMRLPKLVTRVYFWQKVHYENVPKFCKECSLQGHNEEECWILDPKLHPKKKLNAPCNTTPNPTAALQSTSEEWRTVRRKNQIVRGEKNGPEAH